MVRWINLGLAVVLAMLLVIELTRSRQPGSRAMFRNAATANPVR